ncbi:MAG: hypothetical protein RLN99_01675 [Kiloniellaceae bacterium]
MNRARIAALCLSLLFLGLAWTGAGPLAGPQTAAQAAETLPVGPEKPQVRGTPLPEVKRLPVNPQQTSNLLFEDDQRIEDFDLDRGLSQLCRQGRFRQQREHLFIVRLGGYVHGAVIGGFWGLYDPERLAVPNLVYALRGQDTGRCEVRVLRHLTDLRQ